MTDPSTTVGPTAPEGNAERRARKEQQRAAKAAKATQKVDKQSAPTPGAEGSSSSKPKSNKAPHRLDPRSQPVDVQLSKALSYILRHGALKEGLTIRPDGYIALDDVLARPRVKSLNMAGPHESKPRRAALQDIQAIVESNDKKRFEIDTDKHTGAWLIRAVQGHSIKQVTELAHTRLTLDSLHLLRPDDLPSRVAATTLDDDASVVTVIHGTDPKAWDLILQSGALKPMTRNHIHLAKGKPGQEGVISGMRKSASRLLFIDICAALRDGIPFFLSSNGVVLTPGATPQGVVPAQPGSEKDEMPGAGSLPIKYILRVEDKSGQIVWRPQTQP